MMLRLASGKSGEVFRNRLVEREQFAIGGDADQRGDDALRHRFHVGWSGFAPAVEVALEDDDAPLRYEKAVQPGQLPGGVDGWRKYAPGIGLGIKRWRQHEHDARHGEPDDKTTARHDGQYRLVPALIGVIGTSSPPRGRHRAPARSGIDRTCDRSAFPRRCLSKKSSIAVQSSA